MGFTVFPVFSAKTSTENGGFSQSPPGYINLTWWLFTSFVLMPIAPGDCVGVLSGQVDHETMGMPWGGYGQIETDGEDFDPQGEIPTPRQKRR